MSLEELLNSMINTASFLHLGLDCFITLILVENRVHLKYLLLLFLNPSFEDLSMNLVILHSLEAFKLSIK